MEIDREMWAPAVASRKKRTMEPAPVATPATLCTLYAAAAGVATLALSVATFLTQPRRDEDYALPCVLLAIGLLLLTAAIASRGTLALGELEPGAKLLILGAAALSIEIAIRLLSSKRFGGHVSNFDFGSGADERNRAFTADFNSFGHCVQGCLSVLLVPAVELALPWTRIVSCLVAVYPTYNLVKRALDASAFAASSFSNNGAMTTLATSVMLPSGATTLSAAYSSACYSTSTLTTARTNMHTTHALATGSSCTDYPPPNPSAAKSPIAPPTTPRKPAPGTDG